MDSFVFPSHLLRLTPSCQSSEWFSPLIKMDLSSDGTDGYTRSFIESRASKFNSTFAVESSFNKSSCKYELKELR